VARKRSRLGRAGPVLDICDREGLPAYLESSKERNVAFYRHTVRGHGELSCLRAPSGCGSCGENLSGGDQSWTTPERRVSASLERGL